MSLGISSDLAAVIARAFASGAETSVRELACLLEISKEGRLVAATQVVDFVTNLHLELVPDVAVGEYETVRVLRSANLDGEAAGRVQRLVDQGEGHTVEFKSSMLCSMREWEKKKSLVEYPTLEGELLKTVCAFINSDGGDLLVGVDDSGKASAGVSLDMQLRAWNLDKWQLHFQALIKDRFYEGTQIQSYLRTQMVTFGRESVFHVSVMPRTTRSFVQRQKGASYEFFIRNGPRTDSLDLPNFYGHMVRVLTG